MGTSPSETSTNGVLADDRSATYERTKQAQREFHERQKAGGTKMIYISRKRKLSREDKENMKLWMELGINPEGREL